LNGFLEEYSSSVPLANAIKGAHNDEPVGVQDSSCVSPEQRNLIRELAPFVQGNDGKGTTAGRIPIDRQIVGIDLQESLLVSCHNPAKAAEGASWYRAAKGSSCATTGCRTFTRLVSQALRLMCRLS
jgi:hypothetical protein